MISLFRCWMVPALLMTLPALSQDVAAPAMANVDLETEEGRARERHLEAIDRVEMLGFVLGMMKGLEMEGREKREIVAAMITSMNSALPPQMLEKCPDDYRKTFKECREESAKLLERMRTEKMDDEQFGRVYEEYCARCNEMNAPLMEKYRLKERGFFLFRIVQDRLRSLDRKGRMKLLQRMRDDLVAGKMKIPRAEEEMEDEAGGRLQIFVR